MKMREIFKYKKGKDFYRDQLEYMEYNPELFQKGKKYEYIKLSDVEENEVTAYRVAKKC